MAGAGGRGRGSGRAARRRRAERLGSGSAAAPRETFSSAVRADIQPRTHGFGETLTALLEVTLPTGAYQPGSLRARGGFDPYVVVGEPRLVTRQVGDLTVARYTIRIRCVAQECLPDGETKEFEFGTPDDRGEARPGVSLSWRVPPPAGRRFADRRAGRAPDVHALAGGDRHARGRGRPRRHLGGGPALVACPSRRGRPRRLASSARCSAARRCWSARRRCSPPRGGATASGPDGGQTSRGGAADAPRTGAPPRGDGRRRRVGAARGARDARRRAARRRRARPGRGDGAARVGRGPAARGRRRRARRVGATRERGLA